MDREAEIARCDEMIANVADLIMAANTQQTLEYTREMYKTEGRGFIPVAFASVEEAQIMIKNAKETGNIDVEVQYMNKSNAKSMGFTELTKLLKTYDPRNSYVVMISIDFKDGTKNCRGRMRAMVMRPITKE